MIIVVERSFVITAWASDMAIFRQVDAPGRFEETAIQVTVRVYGDGFLGNHVLYAGKTDHTDSTECSGDDFGFVAAHTAFPAGQRVPCINQRRVRDEADILAHASLIVHLQTFRGCFVFRNRAMRTLG